ncbi:MAG: hypothetical protein R3B70_39455 [Polyangiaceae bacterium]
MVRATLKEALDAAEPLCAAGKNAPCAQLIEGALGDIASSLSPGCQRPRKLIARTKESAAAETTPKGRATFLRGAARTLLDMVED